MADDKNMPQQDLSQLYQIISEEAIMGIVAFDSENETCFYANNLAKEMLELADKDIPHLKLASLYPERNQVQQRLRTLCEDFFNHEGVYQDVIVRKKNGQNFIANLGVNNVDISEKKYLILMMQDITVQKMLQRDVDAKQQEIKSAYEELLVQNKQLKELDIAKDRFIALTTHELRTPLSAVLAASEVLKLKLYDDEEQMSEFIDMIFEQGNQLMSLINDILDFAKIQAGRMDLFVKNHNLADLCQSQVEALQQMAEKAKVTLSIREPETEYNCYYDDVRLKQVLDNIINNAIKYNKQGGTVEVWLEADDEITTVFVKDNGKGISSEDQEKVFNEFETLGKVAQHHKGTGLGMPITKRLIEAMGGKIYLDSEVDTGTTFWVEVPNKKILADDIYRDRPDDSGDLAA